MELLFAAALELVPLRGLALALDEELEEFGVEVEELDEEELEEELEELEESSSPERDRYPATQSSAPGMASLLGVLDRKSTRLNSSHWSTSRMPSSA